MENGTAGWSVPPQVGPAIYNAGRPLEGSVARCRSQLGSGQRLVGVALFCAFKLGSSPDVDFGDTNLVITVLLLFGSGFQQRTAEVPALRMEVAAAKIRAALELGISFSSFSQY
jgi:hypothetical protein